MELHICYMNTKLNIRATSPQSCMYKMLQAAVPIHIPDMTTSRIFDAICFPTDGMAWFGSTFYIEL